MKENSGQSLSIIGKKLGIFCCIVSVVSGLIVSAILNSLLPLLVGLLCAALSILNAMVLEAFGDLVNNSFKIEEHLRNMQLEPPQKEIASPSSDIPVGDSFANDDEPDGWKRKGKDVLVCPQCGHEARDVYIRVEGKCTECGYKYLQNSK